MIHPPMKSAGDVAASIGAGVAVASHWAEVLTPILTFLIALATAVWWVIRYVQHFSAGRDAGAGADKPGAP